MKCEHFYESVDSESVIVYREVDDVQEEGEGEGDDAKRQASIYRVCRTLDDFPAARSVPLDKADPKIGVSMLSWSPSERYLATKNDNLPSVVWIWNVVQKQLVSVLLQRQPVRFMKWEPENDVLGVCCCNSRIYLWSPDGASVVHVPFSKFQGVRMMWNKRSSNLILSDSHTFCIGYLLDTV